MEGNQNASRNQNINMSAGIFLAHARSLTLGADLFQWTDATGVISPTVSTPFPNPCAIPRALL